MKYYFIVLLFFLVSASAMGQVPEKFNYQTMVRDSLGAAVFDRAIGVQLSILSGSSSGTAVFVETHTDTTNANGLLTLVIGGGTLQSGDFSAIDWADNSHYLKVEMDVNGGTAYELNSVTELISVPYALYAGQTGSAVSADYVDSVNLSLSATGDSLLMGNGHVIILPKDEPEESGSNCVTETAVVEVTSSTTSRVWMDRNLGASQVATSKTDSLALGNLFQWGRAADGHQCRESETTSTQATTATIDQTDSIYGKFILGHASNPYDWLSPADGSMWQGSSGVNNPCPSGFYIPTKAEWEAEIAGWSSGTPSDDAFNSALKIPIGGSRGGTSGWLEGGTKGYYWSSDVSTSPNLGYSIYLEISDSFADGTIAIKVRATGMSVRCIKSN